MSHNKIGDVQVAQGNLPAALKSYQASMRIRERLAQADAGNAEWQRDLSVSHEKIGDVQVPQGNLAGALESYRASMRIRERLAQADPGNAGWQRDVWTSMWRLAGYSESGVTWSQIVDRIEAMERSGTLLPTDHHFLEQARRNAEAARR